MIRLESADLRDSFRVSGPGEPSSILGEQRDIHSYSLSQADLRGVAKGLTELGPEYCSGLCSAHAVKRNKVRNSLEQAGLRPHVPQVSYYVLADVSRLPGLTSKEKAMYLLSKTTVASMPGGAFFHDGDGSNLVRFCFAETNSDLDEACRRIERLS